MNPYSAKLQERAEVAAGIYFRSLPAGITIADAVTMPWCGERNLVLRRALGLDFPGRRGEACMMNQADVIQVVMRNRTPAVRVERLLSEGLDADWTVTVTERPDGGWLVQAHPPIGEDELAVALGDLDGLLGRG